MKVNILEKVTLIIILCIIYIVNISIFTIGKSYMTCIIMHMLIINMPSLSSISMFCVIVSTPALMLFTPARVH